MFKPGVHQQCSFLKLSLMLLCVCVFALEATINLWHDMDPI